MALVQGFQPQYYWPQGPDNLLWWGFVNYILRCSHHLSALCPVVMATTGVSGHCQLFLEERNNSLLRIKGLLKGRNRHHMKSSGLWLWSPALWNTTSQWGWEAPWTGIHSSHSQYTFLKIHCIQFLGLWKEVFSKQEASFQDFSELWLVFCVLKLTHKVKVQLLFV